MTKTRQAPKPPPSPARRIIEFEVSNGGTLRIADFPEPETRADFYDDVSSSWSESPTDLADAMIDCPPLARAISGMYLEYREALESDLEEAGEAGERHTRRLVRLKARVKALPEEGEEGAADWLLGLSSREFEELVVPRITEWFNSAPDWDEEGDYQLELATSQGAALRFFQNMTGSDRDKLRVRIVEGDHPGSSYYAAELSGDIDEANRAAEAADIPVRFVPGEY